MTELNKDIHSESQENKDVQTDNNDQGSKDEQNENKTNEIPPVEQVIKNKPKLIIDNYELTPSMPMAGHSFTMNLSFYNTNSEYSVRNIKISLSSESGTGANGQTIGGTVFSPVNSSNTFYIPYIAPGDSIEKTIKMAVLPNAAAQNYTITATYEYEDYLGNPYTATETVGVPVIQEAKIGTSEVITMGLNTSEPTNIDLDFFNSGKDTLSNLMISIEGTNLEVMGNSTQFVGNFSPGSSEHFSANVLALAEGEVNGKIILSYETSTGETKKLEKEFSTFAMNTTKELGKTGKDGMNSEIEIHPKNNHPASNINYSYIGAGLAIIVIILVVLYRYKKKKKENLDLEI